MSEKEASWTVVPVSSSSVQDDHPNSTQHSQSAWLYFPLCAFGAVFGSIVCWGLTGYVLYKSHNELVEDWAPQPAVYLSILSALSAACLRLAYTHGSAIQWWVEVKKLGIEQLANDSQELQAGPEDDPEENDRRDAEEMLKKKLKRAHEFWKSTHSFPSALGSLFSGGVLSSACILLTLLPASSPLLQRASYSAQFNNSFPTTFSIQSRTSLPVNFTGLMNGADRASALTPDFSRIVHDWNSGSPIYLDDGECFGGLCNGTLKGVGLAPECTTTVQEWNFAPVSGSSAVFDVGFSFTGRNSTSPSQIGTLSVFAKDKGTVGPDPNSCSHPMKITTCTFSSAVIGYNVSTDGEVVFLNRATSYMDDKVIHLNNTDQQSSWSGLFLLLSNIYNSTATLTFSNGYNIASSGTLTFLYVNDSSPIACEQSWSDPTPLLLENIRQLMFRTALTPRSENDDTTSQDVASIDSFQYAVFQSDYKFLAASMIVSGLSLAAVLAMSFRWKSLKRKVDLSPFSISELLNSNLRQYQEKKKSWYRKGFRGLIVHVWDWYTDDN